MRALAWVLVGFGAANAMLMVVLIYFGFFDVIIAASPDHQVGLAFFAFVFSALGIGCGAAILDLHKPKH